MNRTALKSLLICLTLIFFSCSKDNDNTPEASDVTTVTTSDFSVNLDENPSEGQIIGTVSGTTNQGTVTFSITTQTPSVAIAIDSDSGEITVADVTSFDFETYPTITAIVKVANGSVFENATITITLSDVYEENIFDGDVEIDTQQEIMDFGANHYTHITGYLYIGKIYQTVESTVTDLSALSTLTAIGGDLTISENNELSSLEGLENITTLNGALEILKNDILESIEALHNITSEINGNLIIDNHPMLTNLNGLENISVINGNLLIAVNDSLSNIDGLNGLTRISSIIFMSKNHALQNVDGLNNLLEVETVVISFNSLLVDFCGLNNLINNGMFDNWTLSQNPYNPNVQDMLDGNCSL